MATINKKFVVKNGLASEEGAIDFFGANTVSLYDGNDAASIVLDANNGAITIGADSNTNWELPTARGSNGYFLKTNTDGVATWAEVPSGQFTISDGANTDPFINGEILTFTGGTGLTSTVANNQVTFDLANTAVTAGDYGSTTQIPVISIDAQGRITSANGVSISTSFTLSDGTNTDPFNNGDILKFTGGTNITSAVANNEVTFNLDDSITLSGNAVSSNTTTGDIVTAGGVGVGGDVNIGGNAIVEGDYLQVIGTSPALEMRGTLDVGSYSGPAVAAKFFAGAGGTSMVSYVGISPSLNSDESLVLGTLPNAGSTGDIAFKTTNGRAMLIDHSEMSVNIEWQKLLIGDTANTSATSVIEGSGTIWIDPAPTAGDANGVVIVKGDLQVQGTTTTVNSTEVNITDLNLTLAANANNATEADGGGITIGGANATFTYVQSTDRWTANKDIAADIVGNVTGNAGTATKLETARTIQLTGDATGSASFDGSANASIEVTIAANSVALGTDTTGDYVESLVAGTGITITDNSGEGATPTITNSDLGSSQNIFKTVVADSGNNIVADSNADTLQITGQGGIRTKATANSDVLSIHVSDVVTFGSSNTAFTQNVSIRGYQEAAISANTDFEVLTETHAVGSKLVFGAVDTADATSRHMIEVMVMTDGTTTYMTQYGEVFTSAALFSLEGANTAGDVQIVPAAGKTIRIKVQEQAI